MQRLLVLGIDVGGGDVVLVILVGELLGELVGRDERVLGAADAKQDRLGVEAAIVVALVEAAQDLADGAELIGLAS